LTLIYVIIDFTWVLKWVDGWAPFKNPKMEEKV